MDAGLLGGSGGSCSGNDAIGKMAKLIVSCTSTSPSVQCICENLGDCTTCMADTRCVWKRKSCKQAPSPMPEKARNKIILGEINFVQKNVISS